MPQLSGLLRRFRFHGVPGAPAGASVPLDRVLGVENELGPVLSMLDDSQQRAAAIVAQAEGEGGALRAAAAATRAQLVEGALAQADTKRLEAAAARLARADQEVADILAAAREERSRIASAVAESMPALTAELVQRVLGTGRRPP